MLTLAIVRATNQSLGYQDPLAWTSGFVFQGIAYLGASPKQQHIVTAPSTRLRLDGEIMGEVA